MDTDHHKIYKEEQMINQDRPIVIGNHCWIGMNSMILKGAYIPDGCVVAAGSTITKHLPKSKCIYVNNDIIKENIDWSH